MDIKNDRSIGSGIVKPNIVMTVRNQIGRMASKGKARGEGIGQSDTIVVMMMRSMHTGGCDTMMMIWTEITYSTDKLLERLWEEWVVWVGVRFIRMELRLICKTHQYGHELRWGRNLPKHFEGSIIIIIIIIFYRHVDDRVRIIHSMLIVENVVWDSLFVIATLGIQYWVMNQNQSKLWLNEYTHTWMCQTSKAHQST